MFEEVKKTEMKALSNICTSFEAIGPFYPLLVLPYGFSVIQCNMKFLIIPKFHV